MQVAHLAVQSDLNKGLQKLLPETVCIANFAWCFVFKSCLGSTCYLMCCHNQGVRKHTV